MQIINIFNESDLHNTLKKIYSLENEGQMEVRLDDTPWICDIITAKNEIIEIQTANLSALTEKALYILETGRKLKIVHPIPEVKFIETYDECQNLISRKKSPKKETIYDSLRGMTKICRLFLHPNCELEILYVETTETREQKEAPVQSKNLRRRHLKNWVKHGKRLEKILRKKTLKNAQDWTFLVPEELLNKEFRLCDFQKAMKNHPAQKVGASVQTGEKILKPNKKAHPAKNAKWASLTIWILLNMGIIEQTRISGRSKFYMVRDENFRT